MREGLSTILDTMPKGGSGGGGLSREQLVDHIAEDLLAKVAALLQPRYEHGERAVPAVPAVRLHPHDAPGLVHARACT